jgi:hypothetical protein
VWRAHDDGGASPGDPGGPHAAKRGMSASTASQGPGVVEVLARFSDPTRCADLPLHAVLVVLMQIACGMTRLTALQNALVARMLTARGSLAPGEGGP